MRCIACNVELNDFESTRKDSEGRYIDMCNHCFKAGEYDIDTNDRLDLLNEADIHYEENSSYEYLTYDSDSL